MRVGHGRELISIGLVFFLVLSVVPFFSTVSGANLYLPGARPGEWVYYGQISTSFYSNIPSVTSNQFITPFEHVTSINSTVTAVVQNDMTVRQLWMFNNGTSPRTIVLTGNVLTGAGNFTSASFGTVPWFLAGGLSGGDALGAGPLSPTINSTTVGSYAGSSWAVNLWNFTSIISSVQQVLAYLWEENTGLLLEHTYSVSFYQYALSETGSLELKATSTNIPSYNPDFTMSSNTTSISTMTNAAGTTTITMNTQENLTIGLAVTSSPSGLTCSVSPVRVNVKLSASSTLSCQGTAGTYQVTVSGASGSKSHTQTFAYQVNSPSPTILGLDPIIFYAIIAAVAAAIALTAITLVRRRKPTPQIPPPTEGPAPSTPPAPSLLVD